MLLFLKTHIAQNLIQNPSFDEYTIPIDCNGGGFEIAGFPTFHHVVNNWYTFSSPDYFNSTCAQGGYNVPYSIFGESNAKSGTAYAGMFLYLKDGDVKEYIRQQLDVPLDQDSVYCLSFFTSRADRTPYAIKALGAYFSVNSPTLVSNYYINAIPQVINTTGFLTDTAGWTEIKGCFIAQGGEQYVTIGNFNSNVNTDTLRIQPVNPLTGPGTDLAYYYIDSVTLWKNNFPTSVRENSIENTVKVYPNPANDILQIKSEIEISRLEIMDISGRVLSSDIVDATHYQKNVKDFSDGVYFVKITSSYGRQMIEKTIISH